MAIRFAWSAEDGGSRFRLTRSSGTPSRRPLGAEVGGSGSHWEARNKKPRQRVLGGLWLGCGGGIRRRGGGFVTASKFLCREARRHIPAGYKISATPF